MVTAASLVAQMVKCPPAMWETWVRSLGREDPLEKKIKRSLLLGRKAMTNLNSVFKSRDIALPTNVHIVKAMIFPVLMYGCESWTIKKAEH